MRLIDVCIATQTLTIIEAGHVTQTYAISSAKNGLGEDMGSECTPRGRHTIRAKIGTGLALNTVFIGRRPTGEIYTPVLAEKFPKRDWILTRILWLGGSEPGFNRYGTKDSTWRYIYIHGCPDHLMQGQPTSHGCLRMANQDVADFFECVDVGDEVFIHQ